MTFFESTSTAVDSIHNGNSLCPHEVKECLTCGQKTTNFIETESEEIICADCQPHLIKDRELKHCECGAWISPDCCEQKNLTTWNRGDDDYESDCDLSCPSCGEEF